MLTRLKEDLKAAMRSGDTVRRNTIRLLMAELKKAQIEKKGELTDEDAITLLTREAKKRREAAEAYRKGDRIELAEGEEGELRIIEDYLPQQMTEDEVKALIAQIVEAVQPQGMRDMGKVMGQLVPKIRGRFDGKAASGLVRAALA